MMEPFNTREYRGYTIEIHPDHCGESPREWDNLGVMYCWHRRYGLGDKDAQPPCDSACVARINGMETAVVVLPLYLYDHSGITMNTTGFSCPWDSGQVGYIYVTREQIEAEYGWRRLTRKRRRIVEEVLRQEVKTYDDYLTGRVFGFIVKDWADQDIDSCWSFFGWPDEDSYIMAEARASVDWAIKQHEEQAREEAQSAPPLLAALSGFAAT